VDKDFMEIAVLLEIFPAATILLCNFNVIKYLKNLIATAILKVEEKNDLMNKLKSAMYAQLEEDCKMEKTALQS